MLGQPCTEESLARLLEELLDVRAQRREIRRGLEQVWQCRDLRDAPCGAIEGAVQCLPGRGLVFTRPANFAQRARKGLRCRCAPIAPEPPAEPQRERENQRRRPRRDPATHRLCSDAGRRSIRTKIVKATLPECNAWHERRQADWPLANPQHIGGGPFF